MHQRLRGTSLIENVRRSSRRFSSRRSCIGSRIPWPPFRRSQAKRCVRSPADERTAFTARLHALSKAHDLLTSDKWDRAPLRDVVDAAVEPFQLERFTLEGPDTWLNASMSLQVTLALHELATNAAKYGALRNANRPSSVDVGTIGRRPIEALLERDWRTTSYDAEEQGIRLYPD